MFEKKNDFLLFIRWHEVLTQTTTKKQKTLQYHKQQTNTTEMDRPTFLQSLPFLHILPTEPDIKIWKIHRDRILEHINSSECINSSACTTTNETKGTNNTFSKEECKNERDKSSIHCLFSNLTHVVSIEPTMYKNGEMGKPAFFRSNCDDDDPALNEFGAYLLPAEINTDPSSSSSSSSNLVQRDEEIISPSRLKKSDKKQRHHHPTSPTSSSASTHMSTSQGTSPAGGKFENSMNDDDDDNEDSSGFKTHLLYFLFSHHLNTNANPKINSFDVYFVDHQNMQSLEVINSSLPSQDVNENDHEGEALLSNITVKTSTPKKTRNMHYKPTSLLIRFDACTFRVFGRDFLLSPRISNNMTSNVVGNTDNFISNYEKQLRSSFNLMKDCITSHQEKLLFLKYNPIYMMDFSLSSLYAYLSYMTYPKQHESKEPESSHEYGQIEKAPTTDEDTTSKSNTSVHENTNTNETLESTSTEEKDEMKLVLSKISSLKPAVKENVRGSDKGIDQGRKRKLRSYQKSWNALEKMQRIVNGKTGVDGLQNNKEFTSLLQRSAVELSKSYVIDDDIGILAKNSVFSSRENGQRELETKISEIQHSVDQKVQTIFALSHKAFKIPKGNPTISEEEIENDLNEYRQTIADRHKLMFMPSR